MESVNILLAEIFNERSLISAILSNPRKTQPLQKINVRPILIKDEPFYQFTEFRDNQALHSNLKADECIKNLQEHLPDFKQLMLYTNATDYQILISKKQSVTILKKPSSKCPLALSHNRKKEYLLADNKPIPFLVELGVMSPEGKIHAQKMDKFRQINRFLEMVDDILPDLNKDKPIHIVDFGCGKSYLTFALYYYLKVMKGLKLTLTGLDLKKDVIDKCNQLAKKLCYSDLSFSVGDINQHQEKRHVDMVISLHACDTATDAALEKAVRWESEVILCVPCCQHELFGQVKNEALEPLLKHGILKERFAALATDAARAQLLEALGYRVQVLEFIDMEHTPKNLLLRAVRNKKQNINQDALKKYFEFKKSLNIDHSLERRFAKDFE
ncbi:MAG: SAM-dependent methyltransferase [Parachlamydiaceae bacterium]|nr:SAM-dependent methyltransferase [Parachlamydiaceae bacterium]